MEAMVPAQWWRTLFSDSMYLKTDGDVVEDPAITAEELEMIKDIAGIRAILEQGSHSAAKAGSCTRILDLCCGQGRHSLQLAASYPHLEICGHDQSAYLISLANERSTAQGVEHRTAFTVGDSRQIPYDDQHFDLVLLMGNSFGYFSHDSADRMVLAEVFRVLKPGGRLLIDVTDGEYWRSNFDERSWEWIDDSMLVCRERQLSKDRTRLCCREVVTDVHKGVIRDQFYQERLYSQAEIETLLKTEGFTIDGDNAAPALHSIANNLSQRHEDSGMMGQRLLIHGVKRVKIGSSTVSATSFSDSEDTTTTLSDAEEDPAASASATAAVPIQDISALPRKPLFSKMVVLMGDPSQPCFGKLNNSWNPEDIETRKKLTDALKALGYEDDSMCVLESHGTMEQFLASRRDHFVFNLCDEGFNNDATKELHVPAYLEIQGLTYSGADPNCLSYCYDKGLVNRSADAIGVPTPKEVFFFDIHTPTSLERLHKAIEKEILYPAFIKPSKGDNSLGITSRSIVRSPGEVDSYLEELESLGIDSVVVQEYLAGVEYGVGMVGNLDTGFHFFPILEVDYSKIVGQNLPPILGFESKWDPSSPYWTDISYRESTLSEATKQKLRDYCIRLWKRFGCRDYARFDFRCDVGRGDDDADDAEDTESSDGAEKRRGTIKLLEVNPNPGWCWDGKFAYMGKLEGKSYTDVLGMILEAAHARVSK
ncbi:uncharacterized protein BJ171DRAFT_442278, partial [Polychytrium aggregatum]|uniref:uncharacterized protein n=1 Tax=Polychytrium aggregatum TaxID=110093 RepID=UPI0022FE44F6